MANTESTTIPSSDKSKAELTTLNKQHSQLVTQLNNNAAQIRKYQKNHQTRQLKIARAQRVVIQDKIKLVNLQIKNVNNDNSPWKHAPLGGGLTSIQSSIYDLQASAIHYTTQWLNETKASTGVPTTISGLSYASASVTVPTSGSAGVTDIVAQQPTVKDQNGNALSNDGAYEISGPANATGVSIDSTIGTVTVEPGATVGTYTVTYAQGSVTETSTLTVSN